MGSLPGTVRGSTGRLLSRPLLLDLALAAGVNTRIHLMAVPSPRPDAAARPPRTRPRGRDQVREALIAAATALFAERGPAQVSLREIAARADVNLGLIPRHFGTKADLLQAVLDGMTGRIPGVVGEGRENDLLGVFNLTAASPYWRILAHLILAGESIEKLQKDFPTMRALVALFEAARAKKKRPGDARIDAAATAAMALGWMAFEPWLLLATGLENDPREDVRDEIRARLLGSIELAGIADSPKARPASRRSGGSAPSASRTSGAATPSAPKSTIRRKPPGRTTTT